MLRTKNTDGGWRTVHGAHHTDIWITKSLPELSSSETKILRGGPGSGFSSRVLFDQCTEKHAPLLITYITVPCRRLLQILRLGEQLEQQQGETGTSDTVPKIGDELDTFRPTPKQLLYLALTVKTVRVASPLERLVKWA